MAIALPLPMQAAEPPGSSPVTTQAQTQPETLVVRANLNTEDKGDLFVQRTSDRDFLLKAQDLKAIGFKDASGTVVVVDGEPHVSLRSLRGVTFSFDERALTLHITAEPYLLPGSSLGRRAERKREPSIPSINSAFLNYALSASGGSTASAKGLGLSGEMGIRLRDYLFLSDASTVDDGGSKKFVRLMSSVTMDDRTNLRRIVIGDQLTPSRDFSNGVNLGGISVTKLYGLDPYLVRFPTQSLSGTVALPSDMEVYVDGQRIRSEKLKPGEFELRDILAYGGAQNVQVVLRDAFGRVQELSYTLYFSDQPLQQGLHEYSYNLGATRRHYGTRSNAYGAPVGTMFHRYGLSNTVTLGWRAEASRHLLNAGPTATAVLGGLGVVNLALASSTIAGRQGTAALASYGYQAKTWSVGFFLRHDAPGYAGLGDPPSMTNRKYEGNVAASYRVGANGSVSLSHTALATRTGITASEATAEQPFNTVALKNRRVTALSYASRLGSSRIYLTASLSHTKAGTERSLNEAFLGLSMQLDKDHAVASSFRGDRASHSESLRLTRNQPIGEGLGYMVSADRSSGETQSTQLRSNIQYNAPAAVLRADSALYLDQGQSVQDHRLSVAGGVLLVGGRLGMSRPVTESYAIVKVGEVPGVGITVNGQSVGKTDAKGLGVIPSLSAYYDNSVSIAMTALPIEYSLPAAQKRVSPSLRSGAFVDFAVTKTQAFTGRLKAGRAGASKPVELHEIRLEVDGKPHSLVTGRGGEFYAENLKPGTYAATVQVEGKPCLFDLTIPKTDETMVDLGEVVCVQRP